MTRQLTPAGLDLIKSFEELRLVGYLPTIDDKPTAGWGHTGPDVKLGETYLLDQANAWLIADTASACEEVERDVTVPLSDDEFGALVCLTFNIGRGAFKGSTLLKKLNAGDHQGAAQQFLVWNKQAGKELAGLDRRRAAEEALFDTPDPPTTVREKNAMAANSQNTGIALGVGASAIDILNWACTPVAHLAAGSHFPIPDDVRMALVVVGGYFTHVMAEVVARTFPPKTNPSAGEPG